MQDFAQILITFAQISPKFAQISKKKNSGDAESPAWSSFYGAALDAYFKMSKRFLSNCFQFIICFHLIFIE